MSNVVVVGGGYAGVMAANRLAGNANVAVTMINPRPAFVERIRLHQAIAGTHRASAGFRQVLSGKVGLVVGTATRIDTAGRSVVVEGGAPIGYDYLIYAVGSHGAAAPEHAYPMSTWEDAQRLRPLLQSPARVSVVGGGPTGIEAASELAERGHTVTLVCGDVLGPYLHDRGRKAVAERLAHLGVRVVEGRRVCAVTREAVHLDDGSELASPVTIWAAGFTVPSLARDSGLSTDGIGRLRTDPTLTSVDDPRVIAAGDCAAPSDAPPRMSCQAAGQFGLHAPRTVLRRIRGEEPRPIGVSFVGQCLSLGRGAGLVQVARPDDTAIGAYLGGRAAAKVKEFVCWSTVKQLSLLSGGRRTEPAEVGSAV